MNAISISFKNHLRLLRSYPLATGIIGLICIIILVASRNAHDLTHRIAYIIAMWLCCFVTDVVVTASPKAAVVGFPIKKPVRKEVFLISICMVLAAIGLSLRFFSGDWQHVSGSLRITVMLLLIFIFPIVLAIVYLFVYKYKLRELGINLRYWYLPVFIHLIVGATTLLFAPESSHWRAMYQEMGILNMLLTGIISAALSEEFSRMLLQTRLGAALANPALGFVFATIIWALLHVPNFGQDFRKDGIWPAFLAAIQIMPVGFMWGYLTHRTKSLFPAVMVHGLNLWGLQNFM